MIYTSAMNHWEKKRPGMTFQDITKEFLLDLENELDIAPSTKGIYLRTLRTIYNMAIERRIVARDTYPFGAKRYIIPASTAHKRSLTEEEKNRLISYEPPKREWMEALRVWKFSYYANGMNCSDIALLRPENIQGDLIVYTRRKTARMERVGKKQVVIIGDQLRSILDQGLFDVLGNAENPEGIRKKTQQWIKTTNKYLKLIGKELKLPIKLTTYTARHTVATMMLKQGANLAYIKDALGHSSISTTENYLSSLNLEEQRKMTARL